MDDTERTPMRHPANEGVAGPVVVGDVRRFLSTLQDEDGFGILVRNYTDQLVTVTGLDDPGDQEEYEPLWRVRAADGVEFSAWDSELIEGGTNVYVLPSGEYASNPEWRGNDQ